MKKRFLEKLLIFSLFFNILQNQYFITFRGAPVKSIDLSADKAASPAPRPTLGPKAGKHGSTARRRLNPPKQGQPVGSPNKMGRFAESPLQNNFLLSAALPPYKKFTGLFHKLRT